jgi:hypothetical protein
MNSRYKKYSFFKKGGGVKKHTLNLGYFKGDFQLPGILHHFEEK